MPVDKAQLKGLSIVLIMVIPALLMAIGGIAGGNGVQSATIPIHQSEMVDTTMTEIVSMRTLNTKFYDSGDGTLTTRTWVKPIHFENEAGELLDFETALRPMADHEQNGIYHDVGVLQNSLRAYFSYEYNTPERAPVQFETRDGIWLRWTPGQQQLIDPASMMVLAYEDISEVTVTGAIDHDNAPAVIEYVEPYPGVTEKYTVSTGKVKHDYVLNSRIAVEYLLNDAPGIADTNPVMLSFSGELEFSNGLIPYVDGEPLDRSSNAISTDSGIEFRAAADGDVKHYLPPPFAYEQRSELHGTGSIYIISEVTRHSMVLGTATPLSWLLDPARNFPVVIDPSDDIYSITPGPSDGKDCFLAGPVSGSVNEELNFGADATFFLTQENQNNWVRLRPLIQFDISDVPIGKEIIYAEMNMYLYDAENGDQGGMAVTVFPLTHTWTEGSGTWNSPSRNGACWLYYDGSNAWGTQGGDIAQNPTSISEISTWGWYKWDINEIFGEWQEGSKTNLGLLMRGSSGADALKKLRTTDHSEAGERPYLEVKVLTQRPPIVKPGAVTNLFLDEDIEPYYLDLNNIFDDPNEEDTLTFSLWLNGWSTGPFESENMTVSIEQNGTLKVTPMENVYGNDLIRLSANDTIFEVYHTLTITILSVNDPPELRLITDKKGVQGSWLNFSFKAKEVDVGQENLLIFGSNVTDNTGTGISDYQTMKIQKSSQDPLAAEVSFLPENQHVGDIYILFWVRDPLGGEDNQTVKFTIKNTNDPPEIKQVIKAGEVKPEIVRNKAANLVAKQDEYLNFTIIVDDPDLLTPDSDVLEFIANRTDDNFKLDSGTGNISFLPGKYDVGNFYVRVQVKDYYGAEDYVDITIKTRNSNDPPMITGIYIGEKFYPSVNNEIEFKGKDGTEQDRYFNFTVTVDDPDLGVDEDEVLKFWTNRSMDFNLVMDTRSGAGSIYLTQEEVGIYYVKIWVMDNDEVEDYISLKIHVADVNDLPPAPVLSVVPVEEGSHTVRAIVTTGWVLDPDGDFLKCIWDFGDGTNPEEKIDAERWTAEHTYLKAGIYEVKLTLDDGRGGLVTGVKNITVGDISTNVDGDDGGTSLAPSTSGEDVRSDFWLIAGVAVCVVIAILIGVFFYMRAGKRLVEEEEEEDEGLEMDLSIPELGIFGPEAAQMQTMMGYGMYPPQYPGYQMYPQQQVMMMPQMGLPPMGMQQPLALPPAQPSAFCPQCGQRSLQQSTTQAGKYICTNCGFSN